MRLLLIFTLAFFGGYLFTESWATEPKPVSDIDALLKKIEQNTQAVGQATKQAHEVSEKLVEAKVVEKEQLKEAVVNAEKKPNPWFNRCKLFKTKWRCMPSRW